jgi:KipI family sensor histidine kinase inhibitor
MTGPSVAIAADVRPYGGTGFLVDLPGLDAVRALHRELVADAPGPVVDVVPAARTVLVTFERPREAAVVRAWLDAAIRRSGEAVAVPDAVPDDAPAPALDVPQVEIPVVYDGADLADVAAWARVSPEEVVARHAGRVYEAAFGGFAPGFTYLVGVDPVIAAPRLPTPRTQVPAGAVALAGDLTAVYPAESPGGWRLLGRTDRRMFDVDRDPPALVAPGAHVRFRPVRGTARGRVGPGPGRRRAAGDGDGDERTLTVLSPGPLALVEDGGRPGLAAIGVGRSGAADRGAAALANRVVGNEPDAALLEVTLGGLVLRAERPAVVALAGAVVPATADGVPVGPGAPLLLPAGAVLRLGAPVRGLRTYVAVRGSVVVERVLGSRSHDVLSGLGPRPLRAGDGLGVGSPPRTWPPVDVAPVRHGAGERRPGERETTLRVLPGPRPEWFVAQAWRTLGEPRTVSADSNRVALRLDGPRVARVPGDLPSEGLVRGAIQVPPDGRPVLFLADHPVTGGYPVIGVVPPDDVDRAAQLRPGDRLRLRPTTAPRADTSADRA